MSSVNYSAQHKLGRAGYQPGRQSGFSLIELMVAITISLLMMAAILQLFLDVTRTNDEMAKSNAQIENGRFAIQLIADDLVHGGFWDGYVPEFDDLTAAAAPTDYPVPYPADPTLAPEPCTAFASWSAAYKTALLGIPVQAYDAVPTGCSAVVTSKKAATDVLVVRHADTCVPGATNCEADTTGTTNKVYFQPSLCASASSYAYVLDTAGFTLQKRTCLASALADKRKYVSNIYYIRNYSVTAGDGIPTLMRAEFGGDGGTGWSVQPLVEGVEGFAVEFGIDDVSDSGMGLYSTSSPAYSGTGDNAYTQPVAWANSLNKTSPTNRGDGAPDGAFVRCSGVTGCTVDELSNVVAVKLYLLVRSLETTPGYTDSKTYCLGAPAADGSCPAAKQFTPNTAEKKYQRHLYSTTVRLTNVSARRETP